MEDLGARFYLCGPFMIGYRVGEEDLIVGEHTMGAVITWADLLADSGIQVFSRAQSDKP